MYPLAPALSKCAIAAGLIALAACSTSNAPSNTAAPAADQPKTAPPAAAAAQPPAKSAAALASATCVDPAQAKGSHGFHCIDTKLISTNSYCLRATGQKPQHVRGLLTLDALVTFGDASQPSGYATADHYDILDPNDPCYDASFAPFMAQGDHITIAKVADHLTLQISDEAAKTNRFLPDALDLAPDAQGGKFYWSGSRNGVDYFVMLADDKLGQLGRNDADSVPRIEHYYRIEAYRHTYPAGSKCPAFRPDNAASSSTGLNVFEWKQGDASCDIQQSLQQMGSGSGGHDNP